MNSRNDLQKKENYFNGFFMTMAVPHMMPPLLSSDSLSQDCLCHAFIPGTLTGHCHQCQHWLVFLQANLPACSLVLLLL